MWTQFEIVGDKPTMKTYLIRLLRRLLRWLTGTIEHRDYIRETRWKILMNPFNDRYEWTILNVRSHIWEWYREATPTELMAWGMLPPDVQTSGINTPMYESMFGKETNTKG